MYAHPRRSLAHGLGTILRLSSGAPSRRKILLPSRRLRFSRPHIPELAQRRSLALPFSYRSQVWNIDSLGGRWSCLPSGPELRKPCRRNRSERGHHDFQLGNQGLPLFLKVIQTAYISHCCGLIVTRRRHSLQTGCHQTVVSTGIRSLA